MLRGVKALPVYIGVFLISLATLVLEISLTRFFSVSKWYHFAFMVVSIALFGIGASGTFLSVFPRLLERNVHELLAVFSGLFSLSCVLSLAATNQVPFDPFRLAWDPMQILYLLVHYVVLAIPFFFSGSCIAVVLSKMARKVGRLYFSDLLGAGLGSILVTAALPPLLGEGSIVFASLMGSLSTLFFALNLPRGRFSLTSLGVMALVVLSFGSQPSLRINISPYKSLSVALTYPKSEVLYTQWNAFSRVDFIKSPYVRYAPGLSYQYRGAIPPQLGITIDGDGLSAITHFDGNLTALEFTNYLPMSLPHQLQRNPRVLILGSGGGLDVLTALFNNASSIVAVEINPILVDAVKHRFGEFSGGIYEHEKVRVRVSESRSFVRGSDEKYDVIQLSLTDNVAASSAGVYALSENYVYTVEAFEDYYEHLSDGGVLCVTRWLLPPPREGVRLVSLGVSALENRGIESPQDHIAVIRSWGTITLLLKKGGFDSGDVDRIREFCRERRFDIVYAPGIAPYEVNVYNRFPEPYYYELIKGLLFSEDRARFYRGYLFDVAPVTDERPFFFHFFRWDKILPLYESMGEKWQPFVEGGYLVPVVFAQALILSVLFVYLPVRRFKGMRDSVKRRRILAYFLCLGLGYMFIEVTLIQRFILVLGHPVYAVSTVLFTLLTFSGMGSLFSGRLRVKTGWKLVVVVSFLIALIIIYLAILPSLFRVYLGDELFFRGLISSISIAPLCFLMGMPFPLGIRLTESLNPDLIPWAWSINGCASVLGSILPVIIALSLGFSVVLALSGIVYLAGLGMIWSYRERTF